MIKSPHTQRQHGSVGRTVGRFPLLTGGWSRAVLNVVLVLLAATTVLADDKQTADGQTKSASDQSTRLQRILDNELPRDVDDLKVMEKHIQGLAKKALDVTVAVIIRNTQGSGVIVSEDGYVLTAAHVAGRPNRRVLIVLPDGRTTQGYTLGAFRSVDAGLIKIGRPDGEDDSNVKWPFVEMGDSKKAALGQWCLATGHPGGYQLDRKPVVRVGRLVHKYKDVLTTDCTLISGDSGGPLFNMEGKVIGVHSRIGFELRHNVHVPVHHYQENWERLLEGEVWGKMPEAPFLGVHGRNDIPKTRISMVDKDGPADKAGIQVGDIILKFGDDKVGDFESLVALVGLRRPGEKVAVTLLRRNKKTVVTVTVGSREDSSATEVSPGFWTLLQAAADEAHFERSPTVKQTATGTAYLGMWQQIALLRPVSVNQRDHTSIRKSFRKVVAGAVKSTVKILADDRVVALGTIVDPDGYILTKASQIPGLTGDSQRPRKVECQFSDGKRLPAIVVNQQKIHDLVLLKVDRKKLPVIEWKTDKNVPVGSWLAVSGHTVEPLAIGVLSLETPFEVKGGVLGIILQEEEEGVGIQRVMPDGGGQRAGLERGDVIVKVNDLQMKNLPMVIETVRQHLPGERITLEIRRGEETLTIKATLGRMGDLNPTRNVVPPDKLGRELSERRSGFPTVLQHDTVLKPNQCGGPLVDLNGKAVGVNIASAGRISTYALPSSLVIPLIKTMKQASQKNEEKKQDN